MIGMVAKKDSNTIPLSSIENQVFILAKFHYDRWNPSEKKLEVMKEVMARLCNSEATDYTDWDIYQIVLPVFNKFASENARNDALIHAFRFLRLQQTVSYQELTRWMLGAISTINIVDGDKLLIDMRLEEKMDIKV